MISAKLLPVIEKDSVQPDCVIVTPAPAIAAEIASTPWVAFVAPKVLSSDEVDARLVVSECRHNAHVVAMRQRGRGRVVLRDVPAGVVRCRQSGPPIGAVPAFRLIDFLPKFLLARQVARNTKRRRRRHVATGDDRP